MFAGGLNRNEKVFAYEHTVYDAIKTCSVKTYDLDGNQSAEVTMKVAYPDYRQLRETFENSDSLYVMVDASDVYNYFVELYGEQYIDSLVKDISVGPIFLLDR